MWEIEQLKLKNKLFAKIKIQNFEFEAPHRNIFNINWNFLARTYFYILLQTFYNIGHAI